MVTEYARANGLTMKQAMEEVAKEATDSEFPF
jgi:hypothetical protein